MCIHTKIKISLAKYYPNSQLNIHSLSLDLGQSCAREFDTCLYTPVCTCHLHHDYFQSDFLPSMDENEQTSDECSGKETCTDSVHSLLQSFPRSHLPEEKRTKNRKCKGLIYACKLIFLLSVDILIFDFVLVFVVKKNTN